MIQPSDNRRLLFMFLALVLVTSVVTGYLWWNTLQSSNNYLSVKSNYLGKRDAVYREIENSDYFKANLADYNSYKKQGKIGAIDRIAWVETLEQISESMELVQFSYELSPSRSVEGSQLKHNQIQVVNIMLRIGFAHDGEIFQFLSDLSEQITAGFEVTSVEIIRTESPAVQNGQLLKPVNLKVLCQINWYSILPLAVVSTTGA